MSTITLNYDPATGALYDKNGLSLGVWFALEPVDANTKPTTVHDLIQLRQAGYTTEEIVELRDHGLLGQTS